MSVKLQWEIDESGTAHGTDVNRDSGPTAVVEGARSNSEEQWNWFIADWPPVMPHEDQSPFPSGRAATREAAMSAAEDAFPTPEQERAANKASDEAWETCQNL